MPILVTSSVCKVILGDILQKLQGVSQGLTEYFIDLIHSYKYKKNVKVIGAFPLIR